MPSQPLGHAELPLGHAELPLRLAFRLVTVVHLLAALRERLRSCSIFSGGDQKGHFFI